MLDKLDGISGRYGRRLVEGSGIDVPRVVILGRVAEELQLIPARTRGKSLEAALLVINAGDAARGLVDRPAHSCVLQCGATTLKIALESLAPGNHVQHLISKRRDTLSLNKQLEGVSGRIAGKHLRRKDMILRVEYRNALRRFGELHADRDQPRALPRQRIKDQHRNALRRARVDAGGYGLHR